MKDEQNDIVKELIPRYLAGETSAEEEKDLLAWIAESPNNERHYRSMEKIFQLSDKHFAESKSLNLDINIDEEWNSFTQTITQKKSASVRKLEPDNKPIHIWYKVAAAVLLLVVSAFVINYFLYKPKGMLYETGDHTLSFALPDGSKVILNRNSSLSYASEFGDKNRTIVLKGEGFFDVSHDATKPFIIQVNNAKVEVLGTSFNIRAYHEVKEVEVIVKTGIVKLSVPDLNSEIKLTAGQKGIFALERKALTSDINKDINFQSWNTQNLVFEENDLRTVIETLKKTYGANITIGTGIPVTCAVTVTFDHQTLEAVLHVLQTTLNLSYKIDGKNIEITSAGC